MAQPLEVSFHWRMQWFDVKWRIDSYEKEERIMSPYPVTGARTVPISPSLSLSHTLLVPSLSNKMMSVIQGNEKLNCVVLIYLAFCLLQDILNKEIIGVVPRERDSITWMTSARERQITCKLGSVARKTNLVVASSFGASIIWLFTTLIFEFIFTFTECRL